ncbi:MAG: site-2 protease family protein [Clostridia bacterium]|nr:site-2 protease family protein [Clostridia bacterium]
MNIIIAILILSFIIIIHELGHYTVGRLCGVGIEEFSVGFGPAILSKTGKSGIKYALRPIIVGGYVRFTGEDEDSADPRAFNNAPVWKRFLTVFAGPGMNFVLAWVVSLAILVGFGYTVTAPYVDKVVPESPAAEAGLLPGDRITAVDGTDLTADEEGFYLMKDLINASAGDGSVTLSVLRDGETLSVQSGAYLDEDGTYKIGVSVGERRHYPLGEAVSLSFTQMRELTVEMIKALKNLIFRGEGVEDVSGTVGIVREIAVTLNEGLYMALVWIMFISLNLGIMNLLPLPALDGGRLVFLIVEAIRRKPFPRDKEGWVHAIGLIAFLGLFVVLTWHDIMRIIHS